MLNIPDRSKVSQSPSGLSSSWAANLATQWLSEPGKEEGGKASPEEEV